ncbi:VOC family protein [Methylobacterium sp. J-076]|uniref:VOC family protein n=1 Tax=Methylobacterium sp. J-076 TaxID=2836655 RepID=UPI001FB86786|nr:VOC family protein [Methylobacterium sp. J-076]MCJ2011889.1 VOC family protein [Methylobacterium sp. J-076]
MTVQVTTHLNFDGRAREALAFYANVFGGEPTLVTYGELAGVTDPEQAQKVIWGQVACETGFRIMAYDVQPERPWHPGENAFYVSLRGSSEDEITAYWNGLSAGATVPQPLGPSAWSPLYGMLKDRFGVTWVVDLTSS